MADLEYQCHWGWVWSWQGGLSVVSVNGMKVNCGFSNAPMILSWVCWRFWRLFLFRADIASRLYAMLRWRSGHCDGRRRDSHVIRRWAGSAETRWFDFVKVPENRKQKTENQSSAMDNNHLKSAKEFELPVDSEARVIKVRPSCSSALVYVALAVPSITFVDRKLGKRVCLQDWPVPLRQASTCFFVKPE